MSDVAAGAAVDRAVLDALLAQLGDDAAMRLDLIDSYLVESADQVATIAQAMAADDPGTVAGVAHSLRSASALLGAVTLAELLLRVEDVARTAPADVADLRPAVESEHARVVEAFGLLRTTG
jgi:HPt (histidine-containing phosphotransfer) domain-containing protein